MTRGDADHVHVTINGEDHVVNRVQAARPSSA
jgi:hypothetical protein